MKLYKYTSVDYVRPAIENGVYGSLLTSFNDPYEYEGIEYLDDYRVCCLTSSNLKMLMWSYYGNHQGCCIEFDVPDDIEIVRKVEYDKTYYQHRDMDGEEIFHNLYKKAYEWEHEKETRIVCYVPHIDEQLWNVTDDQYYFRAPVTKVMLGMRMNLETESVQDLLRYLRDWNENSDRQIVVTKCMLDNMRYALKENRQFQYLRHIV